MWTVYKLNNFALSECYVGVTDGDPHDSFHEAANGGVELIDYWDAGDHKITMDILKACDTQAEAESLARQAIAKGHCLTILP
jgi:hypothetical protein